MPGKAIANIRPALQDRARNQVAWAMIDVGWHSFYTKVRFSRGSLFFYVDGTIYNIDQLRKVPWKYKHVMHTLDVSFQSQLIRRRYYGLDLSAQSGETVRAISS